MVLGYKASEQISLLGAQSGGYGNVLNLIVVVVTHSCVHSLTLVELFTKKGESSYM